jgi:threonine dehydrogenase-like Zn-dependent dehydrogenase
MTELFMSYLLQGRMDVSPLVTHRFSPMEAPDAYTLLSNHRDSAMGVLFDWSRLD